MSLTDEIRAAENEVARLRDQQKLDRERADLALVRLCLSEYEEVHARCVARKVIYAHESHYSHHRFDKAMRGFDAGLAELRSWVEAMEKHTAEQTGEES